MSSGVTIVKRSHALSSVLAAWALVVSLIGLAVSVWAHLATLLGVDPALEFSALWLFPLILLALLIPVALELFSSGNRSRILRSPRWMQVALCSLLVYYGLNFYLFLFWSVNHLASYSTWRMFSAGWLLLFGVAAVFYQVGLLESRRRLHQ